MLASTTCRPHKGKASTSFLKKRSKKSLLLRTLALTAPHPTVKKSFLLLFFKKEALPCRNAPTLDVTRRSA
jgi:hypothetical protein